LQESTGEVPLAQRMPLVCRAARTANRQKALQLPSCGQSKLLVEEKISVRYWRAAISRLSGIPPQWSLENYTRLLRQAVPSGLKTFRKITPLDKAARHLIELASFEAAYLWCG